MNQLKLVLFSLAIVMLVGCGGESDSKDVSAELKQTLPEINKSLSSQSPEGIWRIASHSLLYSSHEIEQISEVWDESSESYSQLLIIIKKDDSSENAYVIYTCDGHLGTKSWELNGDTLSYGVNSDNDFSYTEQGGDLMLDNNLSLVGEIAYKKNGLSYGSTKNTIYTGVKVSDAVHFNEAQNLNVKLEISGKDTFYQLSGDLMNPSCLSISHAEGKRKMYTPATDSAKTYNRTSTSFLIEMMGGDRVGVDEITTVIDRETSVNFTRYYPDIEEQDFQLTYCPENSGISDKRCLKSFIMVTSAETTGMSASSKGESIAGEIFEVSFSYSQE